MFLHPAFVFRCIFVGCLFLVLLYESRRFVEAAYRPACIGVFFFFLSFW